MIIQILYAQIPDSSEYQTCFRFGCLFYHFSHIIVNLSFKLWCKKGSEKAAFWQQRLMPVLLQIQFFYKKTCQIIFIGKNFLKTGNFNRKQKHFLDLAFIGLSPGPKPLK